MRIMTGMRNWICALGEPRNVQTLNLSQYLTSQLYNSSYFWPNLNKYFNANDLCAIWRSLVDKSCNYLLSVLYPRPYCCQFQYYQFPWLHRWWRMWISVNAIYIQHNAMFFLDHASQGNCHTQYTVLVIKRCGAVVYLHITMYFWSMSFFRFFLRINRTSGS